MAVVTCRQNGLGVHIWVYDLSILDLVQLVTNKYRQAGLGVQMGVLPKPRLGLTGDQANIDKLA